MILISLSQASKNIHFILIAYGLEAPRSKLRYCSCQTSVGAGLTHLSLRIPKHCSPGLVHGFTEEHNFCLLACGRIVKRISICSLCYAKETLTRQTLIITLLHYPSFWHFWKANAKQPPTAQFCNVDRSEKISTIMLWVPQFNKRDTIITQPRIIK